MEIHSKYSLINHNTFRIAAHAKKFIRFEKEEDLPAILMDAAYEKMKKLVIGEGSNILFTGNYDGLVIQPNIKGIEILHKTDETVVLKAGAGENWDDFVSFCVENHFSGLENLSLIPGTVGSAPIQNIGAYGVEVKDSILEVSAYDTKKQKFVTLHNKDCHFAYRDSIFKQKKDTFIILYVTFRLSTKHTPVLHYGHLKESVAELGEASMSNIRKAVIGIRNQKLPDPKKLGNGGSFFKNPVISRAHCKTIQSKYPDLPCYTMGDEKMKVAAGWLIDQCGWKGYRDEDAGVHDKQALVLVNYGHATGKQIVKLAGIIQRSVNDKFNIWLEPEINIV